MDNHMLPGLLAATGLPEPAADAPLPDSSEQIYIAPVALLKMLNHVRAGVPMEVMGLMLQEFLDEYTVTVVDLFAMPQSGTGVSVEANGGDGASPPAQESPPQVLLLHPATRGGVGAAEFGRRAKELGRVRRPNVVAVRAYFQAKEERLLVYDYYPNGSLFSVVQGQYTRL
ncbi:probable inactive receptor kinase At1g27190 [Hordeum vulgare subsp. vulgare]|uniref:probable inactive receptor kinase At1g27190 n=1 Tax=Hordeum vulgare subsp. vulgare TaxID=112509 RepID=UPI001D1A5AF5|nr:probable inactive receptor kinase At1g27190 [Hordeum vulgare subsp. vulgare]